MVEDRFVKLEFQEAKQAKADILSSEMFLLQAIKSIRTYTRTRKQDLQAKINLRISIRKLIQQIKNTENLLPEDIKEPIIESISQHKDLDSQLEEIRQKLKEISG